MSFQSKQRVITFGKHGSTTDLTSTPGSLIRLMPEVEGFRSPSRVMLARNPVRSDSARRPPFAGPKDVSKTYALEQIIRGVSGNTGAAFDVETTTEIGKILDVIFGADSVDPANAVTTATGGTPASKLLGVNARDDIPNGMAVMFQGPAGTYHIRRVVSGGGAAGAGNLTVDRIWTGAVAAGQNIIRSASWVLNPAVHMHTHGFFRAETTDGSDEGRRDYVGCMSLAQMRFDVGQYGRLITSWRANDVADNSEENPSVTDATAGNAIVNAASFFFLGDEVYMAKDIVIDLGGTLEAREANNGPNGVQGYAALRGPDHPPAKLSLKAYRGSGGATFGEIGDSSGNVNINKLQAWDKSAGEEPTIWDVAIQAGVRETRACYAHGPAAVCTKLEEITIGGLQGLDLEFEFFTPVASPYVGFAPLSFHLF